MPKTKKISFDDPALLSDDASTPEKIYFIEQQLKKFKLFLNSGVGFATYELDNDKDGSIVIDHTFYIDPVEVEARSILGREKRRAWQLSAFASTPGDRWQPVDGDLVELGKPYRRFVDVVQALLVEMFRLEIKNYFDGECR